MEIEFEELDHGGGGAPDAPPPDRSVIRTLLVVVAIGAVVSLLFVFGRPDPGETAAGTPRTSSTTAGPVVTETSSATRNTTTTSAPSVTSGTLPTGFNPTIGDVFVGDDGHDRVRTLVAPFSVVAWEDGWVASAGGGRAGLFTSTDGLNWDQIPVDFVETRRPIGLHVEGTSLYADTLLGNEIVAWEVDDDGQFRRLDSVPQLGSVLELQGYRIDVTSDGMATAGSGLLPAGEAAEKALVEEVGIVLGREVDDDVCRIEVTTWLELQDCDGGVVEVVPFNDLSDAQVDCLVSLDFQTRGRSRVFLRHGGAEIAAELSPGDFLGDVAVVESGALLLVADLSGFCEDGQLEGDLRHLGVDGRQTVLTNFALDGNVQVQPELIRRRDALHMIVDHRAFVLTTTEGLLLDQPVELDPPQPAGPGVFLLGAGPLLGFAEIEDERPNGRVWFTEDSVDWWATQIEEDFLGIDMLASSEQMAIVSVRGPAGARFVRVTRN